MGRADYNEAINKTDDDQLLMAVVRGRYGETFSLLAVTGVAANVRFGTNAGVELGFGPNENYDGNLVPFSGGLAYERTRRLLMRRFKASSMCGSCCHPSRWTSFYYSYDL